MSITYDIESPIGALRYGVVLGVNSSDKTMSVRLRNSPNLLSNNIVVTVDVPYVFLLSNGLFVGGLPSKNTNVLIARAESGEWKFVSFVPDQVSQSPELEPGTLLIRSSDDTKITLDTSNNIKIGSDLSNIHLDTARSTINSIFDRDIYQNLAKRSVFGIVKRDVNPSLLFQSSKDFFDDNLKYDVGLDPTASISSSSFNSRKNPPFVESRSVIYEFAKNYSIRDDLSESKTYSKSWDKLKNKSNRLFSRSNSNSDTLNLNLSEPNILMESVKGTVIDIFGNILDLNRMPIPIGKDKNLSIKNSEDPSKTFLDIRASERKSIAFHFEINSRKANFPDIDSKSDFARSRSRFFIDIDKEGQFKINVPASSETGNIPLHTRYENLYRINLPNGKNLPQLTDVVHDAFSILDQVKILDGDRIASPLDRIELSKNENNGSDNNYITLGTPYHNILKTCFAFQEKSAKHLIKMSQNIQHSKIQYLVDLEPIKNIVQPTIKISGPSANAGGRSGAINLDGFFTLSVGANTSDKQSAWIDMQGGIIANLGRDKNDISAAISMDGDLIVQIGQNPEDPEDKNSLSVIDSRFGKQLFRGGVLDIRVLNEGNSATVVRIDKNGVTILTPGVLTLKGSEVNVISESNLLLEGESVIINERSVARFPFDNIG